jgi:hypothetical protein
MDASREVLTSADRYPGQISWDYDRAEIIADGAVHAIGVCLGLIGAVTIVVIAEGRGTCQIDAFAGSALPPNSFWGC